MNNSPILIFGKNGQVGQALQEIFLTDSIVLDENEANFTNPQSVVKIIHELKPKLIINAAAYTAVDKAETDKELCMQINAMTPKEIAQTCALQKIPLIHYSSDYVFNGDGDQPREEMAPTAPLNYYGKSKLIGEQAILSSGCHHYILRTSWVYSHQGNNFVKTMLKLGADKETLSIVDDQIGSPTYALDLANATLTVTRNLNAPSGLYNVTNQGFTSWFQFAKKIFSIAEQRGLPLKLKEVKAIKTYEYKTPALRPLNSRLNTSRFTSTFGLTLPTWEDSLSRCMEILICK